MLILLKEQINNYRFTVGKVIFLLEYRDYRLISDLKDSNCMLVFDKNEQRYFYISIFQKPTIPAREFMEDYPIHIFYQTRSYKNEQRKLDERTERQRIVNEKTESKNRTEIFELSSDFDMQHTFPPTPNDQLK